MLDTLTGLCLILATLGLAYTVIAIWAVRRFGKQPPLSDAPANWPAVSILKPVHGDHPGLLADLLSFADQDYPGPRQIVLGLRHADDPARPVIEDVIRLRPELDIVLVVDGRADGRNGKIANVINMRPAIAHEVVVLADSDIRVERGYLKTVVRTLLSPGVGLVTCLYCGDPRAGLIARLSAMAVDDQFLPSVLVGRALGLAAPAFGSTLAFKRQTLEAIGGFERFKDVLADDHALGTAIRALGLTIAVPPIVVRHAACEVHVVELLRHELRWARTIRRVDPWGFAGSIVTYPVPWSIALAALTGFEALALGLLVAALAARHALRLEVLAIQGTRHSPILGPLRDVLSLAVFLMSFVSDRVAWRGKSFTVQADGSLTTTRDAQG